jgi:hypothetical protein
MRSAIRDQEDGPYRLNNLIVLLSFEPPIVCEAQAAFEKGYGRP